MTYPPFESPARCAAPGLTPAQRLQDAATSLSLWLSRVCHTQVEVVWTHNRSTMLSYRRELGRTRLRLHHMFVHAQSRELQAIADYIQGHKQSAARLLDVFIAAHRPKHAPPQRRIAPAQGAVHDLATIFKALNHAYFHAGCHARITWGSPSRTRRTKRSIQLGCYVPEDNLIRMHPCLDQSFVPLYFVTGVVFHEMLHEVFGIGQNAGRRTIHPPEFVAVEQSHPDYQRCEIWERQHLGRLLRWQP